MSAHDWIAVSVKETGHDNYARVVGYSHRASSTYSPTLAARRAAWKYFCSLAAIDCLPKPQEHQVEVERRGEFFYARRLS